ncbi:hypothetical protein CH352_00455 [Leptospira hartskeerlii]|uniref:DUF3052 domain-containing protein n=1 Tax=Leptospira hartskeerlii TaxID=2023177 RepID=A0A2M9X8Y5_9LEPT|nr:hypothetical protein [Leptospira hartskeerlii]PJZ24151.1 hypothetical protein CH357_17560 [Leptospira hartskeerlii]PJZ35145.1 hypothetical protein CH352_00455 [Leptospira hartskeerlii]
MAIHSVFGKLQFKPGEGEICVLSSPYEFEPALSSLGAPVDRALRSGKRYRLILAFVQTEVEIRNIASMVPTTLIDDGLLWLAYPKKTSRKYNVSIHRDAGWDPLGKISFEGVRLISIDDDWSALRFRHTSHIKNTERDPSLTASEEGKKRVVAKKKPAKKKTVPKKSSPKKKAAVKTPKKKAKKK